MTAIPPEAVTAAAAVHMQAINDLLGQKRTEETEAHIARVMLEAALPFIADAERERIRPALQDALEGLEDMFPYVPEYFREKWEHQGYIDRAKTALADLTDGEEA